MLIVSGDQSAMNELMQMRLRSGGTEGLLAEKLEVTSLHASSLNTIVLLSINIAAAHDSRARTCQKRASKPGLSGKPCFPKMLVDFKIVQF